MLRRSFLFVLPLLAACASPVDQGEEADASESLAEAVTASSVFVRITGTCFQSYDMTAVNTGATLGASQLVFKPGEESKQFAFCAGTDRIILFGRKTVDGKFAVDNVWIQQSGENVAQNVEIVRALRTANGATFERALNRTEVRRVSFRLGSQVLSETSSQQFANGRILFAGPRGAASASGGTGGYGQPAPSASGARRVDAVFQELP